jgi:hypothetical protein
LGLFVSLSNNYIVKSNLESGYGRADVLLIPNEKERNLDKKGIVIEFKKLDIITKETIELALEKAMTQIEKKKYISLLIEAGVYEKNIIKIGIVFDGKNVYMKWTNHISANNSISNLHR